MYRLPSCAAFRAGGIQGTVPAPSSIEHQQVLPTCCSFLQWSRLHEEEWEEGQWSRLREGEWEEGRQQAAVPEPAKDPSCRADLADRLDAGSETVVP